LCFKQLDWKRKTVAAEAGGQRMEIVSSSEPINDPSFVENYIDNFSARRQSAGKDGHNGQHFHPAMLSC